MTSGENFNTTQANIAVNACRSNIITCMSVNGYSIEQPTPAQLSNWVAGIMGIGGSTGICSASNLSGCTNHVNCFAMGGTWRVDNYGIGTCGEVPTASDACYIDETNYNSSNRSSTGGVSTCNKSLAQCIGVKASNKLCFWIDYSNSNGVHCSYASRTEDYHPGCCYNMQRQSSQYSTATSVECNDEFLLQRANNYTSITRCEYLGGTVSGTGSGARCVF